MAGWMRVHELMAERLKLNEWRAADEAARVKQAQAKSRGRR